MQKSLLLILFVAVNAYAQQANVFSNDTFQPLATVTNDRDNHVDELYVVVNAQDAIQGIRFVPDHAPKPWDFTNAQMNSPSGANLEHDPHNPIMLHAQFNPKTPNQVNWVIDYLYNGFTGSYGACRAAVMRDSRGEWHIVNVYKNTWVTQLRVLVHRMPVFGTVLGISTIQGVCP